MIENTFIVKDRKTGDIYACFPQMVDLNNSDRYVLRYNIGIDGYTEWINICYKYSNDDFNASYEVLGLR